MRSKRAHSLATLVTALALLQQLLLPGTMALAEARGLDLAGLMCGPGQTRLDPESAANADILAELLETPDTPSQTSDHCPLCAVSHGSALVAPVLTLPVWPLTQSTYDTRRETTRPQTPRGPPLGSRGPPALI